MLSSPLKPLNQIKPNLAGMVPGWFPFKIVSDSPALHSRWLLLLKIEQFWPFEEISIFSNSGHLEWRAGLSDTFLKGTHPRTIPARFGLIWLSGFRGKDLNVIFSYMTMSGLIYNLGFSVKFFFQPIIQIRHILIKDHI
jgi:hypothetical protein